MHPEPRAASAQRFNALKHGGYAQSVLLPGDDAAAFRRERRGLFHNYRPQTQDEAALVEAMAEHHWVAQRFRPVQAWFDGQAVTPETDGAGRVCEPIAHQRLHSGMDVTVQRQRIEKLWHGARTKLVWTQKLRRQGLIEGAVALPKNCYMETDGRVFGPIVQPVIVPIPEPDIDDAGTDRGLAHDGGVLAPIAPWASTPTLEPEMEAPKRGDAGVDRDPLPDGGALPASRDEENGKYMEQKETRAEAQRLQPVRATSTESSRRDARGGSRSAPQAALARGTGRPMEH